MSVQSLKCDTCGTEYPPEVAVLLRNYKVVQDVLWHTSEWIKVLVVDRHLRGEMADIALNLRDTMLSASGRHETKGQSND